MFEWCRGVRLGVQVCECVRFTSEECGFVNDFDICVLFFTSDVKVRRRDV